MKIIFFGSSHFAVPSLEALLKSCYDISCVVTQPDREKGRGLHLEPTAVKVFSLKHNLRLYQPESVNTEDSAKFLEGLKADLFIVIAYGQILSPKILNIPKVFAINAHASLLPKYRGAAPINWVIINGDKTTGVTIMKMAEKMDAGPVISRESLEITEEDNDLTLEDKLAKIAALQVRAAAESIEKGSYRLVPQDEKLVSYAPKLKKEDGHINWARSAENVANLIKGCLGWPGAFTYYKGKLLKIFKARVVQGTYGQSHFLAGQIVEAGKSGFVLACAEGFLRIEELQIEGKRRMYAVEFLAGHRVRTGDMLDPKKDLHFG